MTSQSPDPGYLHDILDYCEHDGALLWKPRRDLSASWNTRMVGRVAGCVDRFGDGYRVVSIDGRLYRAHRIVWAMHREYWPSLQIDHINGDRLDNRIFNLREVTAADNNRNRGMSRRNTSGATGVSWSGTMGKWYAYIQVDKQSKNLGYYDTFDAAVVARKAAETRFGFHKNHGRVA